MINHCDRRITLLSDTDTVVVSHGMINHCDRAITLPSDTDTVVRYNVITHCDRPITLCDTDTVVRDIA